MYTLGVSRALRLIPMYRPAITKGLVHGVGWGPPIADADKNAVAGANAPALNDSVCSAHALACASPPQHGYLFANDGRGRLETHTCRIIA
jgi:hypothetical protein